MESEKNNIKRFSLKGICSTLVSTLLGTDNTFYRTTGNLFYRPGHMVRDYLTTDRNRYLQPVRMLVALITVYLLLSQLVFLQDRFTDMDVKAELLASGQSIFLANTVYYVLLLLQNQVLRSLLLAFVLALPFTLFFRNCPITFPDDKKDSLNVAEHFYTLVYVSCQWMLINYITLLTRATILWEPGPLFNILIFLFLYTWCYKQLLQISWWKSFWRILVATLITIGIIALIVFFLYKVFYRP